MAFQGRLGGRGWGEGVGNREGRRLSAMAGGRGEMGSEIGMDGDLALR